jgi:hypothetical protein
MSCFFRNVPGPVCDSHGRYSGPLPYYATRGGTGTTYPGPWDGVSQGGPSSQVPASPRVQLHVAHDMPSPQPPIVPSTHPEFHQTHLAQPIYAQYPPPSPSFVHQQSPEPLPVFTTANGSQLQGSAGVQNVAGGTYYPLWCVVFTFCSVAVSDRGKTGPEANPLRCHVYILTLP